MLTYPPVTTRANWILVGYESFVYGISRNRGSDAFGTTTRKLAEYIARTFPNGGEFTNAMNPNDLGFDALAEPADPTLSNNNGVRSLTCLVVLSVQYIPILVPGLPLLDLYWGCVRVRVSRFFYGIESKIIGVHSIH